MIEPFKVQSFNRLLIFSFSLAAAYDAYPFQFAQVSRVSFARLKCLTFSIASIIGQSWPAFQYLNRLTTLPKSPLMYKVDSGSLIVLVFESFDFFGAV
ncbi:hypothetical protein AWRIB418_48 [Oenococcus oeni AWRIB418]|nr:hypothetical protein AWRIB418_48 [Oenococcus oeni AWRIB418]